MKSTLKVAVLAFGISMMAGAAQAEGMYGSIQYGVLDAKDVSANPTVLYGSLGYKVNQNFSVEGRAGTGAADDVEGGVNIHIDSYYGIYAKASAPVTDNMSVYGMLGYSYGKLTGSYMGQSAWSDDTSASYGFGADIGLTKTLSVTLEYARIFQDTNAMSIGLAFNF